MNVNLQREVKTSANRMTSVLHIRIWHITERSSCKLEEKIKVIVTLGNPGQTARDSR